MKQRRSSIRVYSIPFLVMLMTGCATLGTWDVDMMSIFDGTNATEEQRGSGENNQGQRIRISEPEASAQKPDPNFRFDEAFMGQPPVPRSEVDFARVDQRVRDLPAETGDTVEELAASLRGISTNQWELARAIFVWIADNIAYDADAFFAGATPPYQAASVIRRGQAVCEGYSHLYLAVADSAGLVVDQVTGYAKGYGHEPGARIAGSNHAWNRVRIYGDWYLIDATWGAGHLEGSTFVRSFNDFYFAPVPEALIFSHLPLRREYQYLAEPLDAETFSRVGSIPSGLFAMGLDPSSVLELVRAGEEFVPPQLYSIRGFSEPTVRVVEIPWDQTLTAGEVYRFSLMIDPEYPLTLVNNDEMIEMSVTNGIANAVLRPSKGDLSITVRESSDARRYHHLIAWQVQ